MTATWVAVGLALTGQVLPAPEPADLGDSPDQVVAWLAEAGWPADRLAAHRLACQQSGHSWPHSVDPAERGPWGAAQFYAVLAQVRTRLGLTGLLATRREGPPQLDAADRRLLADRPPHHG